MNCILIHSGILLKCTLQSPHKEQSQQPPPGTQAPLVLNTQSNLPTLAPHQIPNSNLPNLPPSLQVPIPSSGAPS